jgi:hypothetical protein
VTANWDLAVANACVTKGSGTVSILLGNGNGTFQPPRNYAKGIDGKVDMAVGGVGASSGRFWILPARGDGSFGKPAVHSVAGDFSLVWNLAVDKFSNRRRPDLGGAGAGFRQRGAADQHYALGGRIRNATDFTLFTHICRYR